MEEWIIESFNEKYKGKLLNRQIFDVLLEAKVLTERWRREPKIIRPNNSIGYNPSALETILPWSSEAQHVTHGFSLT
ncbi:MAG: transposase [Deltaproteobacteria bacterium]|uniref:Transposase n=1 Tax=Candidatus Zymogenus saltonus TaxID=2844893 RepID=A0A9D8PRM7_9DELT|nr:transposase [Candidatus Zymogenus saltonus]